MAAGYGYSAIGSEGCGWTRTVGSGPGAGIGGAATTGDAEASDTGSGAELRNTSVITVPTSSTNPAAAPIAIQSRGNFAAVLRLGREIATPELCQAFIVTVGSDRSGSSSASAWRISRSERVTAATGRAASSPKVLAIRAEVPRPAGEANGSSAWASSETSRKRRSRSLL